VSIKDAILPEFDHEMGVTRKLLDRLPDGDMAWKPHDKSMSMGQLAQHVADIPTWAGAIFDKPSYDLAEGGESPQPKQAASRAAALDAFDKAVAEARARLTTKSDAELMAPWSLKRDGQEIFTVPVIGAFRSFILNHSIHHRGQMSVYLRVRNVPIPSIYGPSADEGM